MHTQQIVFRKSADEEIEAAGPATHADHRDDRYPCQASGMDYPSKPIKVGELQEKLHAYCRTS